MTPREMAEKLYSEVVGIEHDQTERDIYKIERALIETRDAALEEAAKAVWSNRWEPPYKDENRMVEIIRDLKHTREGK